MATRVEIDATYNYMDEVWRACLGDDADITCALYDGHPERTLEEAQLAKHRSILSGLQLEPGMTLLDVGCGWGGLLAFARAQGVQGAGMTLSAAQWKHCARAGLAVELRDWRDWKEEPEEPAAQVDAIASVGAFEHFCSEADAMAGRQDDVYARFFEFCAGRLRSRGRLFLQTMTQGARFPDVRRISMTERPGSDGYVLACLRSIYPGSWLPTGQEAIEDVARPLFRLIESSDGREDYIRTMTAWEERLRTWSTRKLVACLKTSKHALEPGFFLKLRVLRRNYNRQCFERRLLGHRRLLFERLA